MNLPRNLPCRRHRQRGAALLALVLLAVVGLVAFMLATFQNEHRPQKRQQTQQRHLAEGRDALVAFATQQWCSSPQPGQTPQWRLPCPAGANSDGNALGACSSTARQTGRLPWRTLVTGPLRDAAAECLWYEREPNQVSPAPPPDTVVARVLAPGPALQGQSRPGSQNGACGNHGVAGDYIERTAPPPMPNDSILEIRYADLQQAATACPAASACTSNAQTLLSNVSGNSNNCRVPPGNSVSASCQAAANALTDPANACSCATEAQQFVNPPCINNLNPPQCQAAITALQSC
ncbi:hypothetical protein [Pseudomarimonas salicorniae]|uniref:Tfp pilus assembly protein PilX n=1 Tax=Pseudomarimonas salicorniae TaxID=2933270 RepID=A0ABT0GFP9_9GAMM|nr:hypothetical protein [Lysobacter sp. CAU 1642]MCK7592845.1 hypothetical protein [Lysobacter sp. CAU 1642]